MSTTSYFSGSRLRRIEVAEAIETYIVDLVESSRRHPGVFLGGSPRASIMLLRAARAYAAAEGREATAGNHYLRAGNYYYTGERFVRDGLDLVGQLEQPVVERVVHLRGAFRRLDRQVGAVVRIQI